MKRNKRNWKKAKQYFIDIGEWQGFNDPVMHHLDESLRHNDVERYNRWNPEDLVVMERSDHCSLHHKGKSKSDDFKEHMKGKNNPMHKYNIDFKDENNPNYGNKWSNEQRRKQALLINTPKYCCKCVETGTIIKCSLDLQEFTGNHKAIIGNVYSGAKMGKIRYGYHWEIIDRKVNE